jgi:hypothetical protein
VVFVCSGIVHKLVVGSRVPVKMTLSSNEMMTLDAVKTAWHPWSQSTPIDTNGWANLGNMCAFLAASGTMGKSNSQVWVALIIVLSGRLTSRPCDVGVS